MMAASVIGVDFGTTRSYFCQCPPNGVQHVPIVFPFGFGGGPGLATAILKQDGQPTVIGDSADQIWSQLPEQERKRSSLRTQFKPHIAKCSHSRDAAIMFLEGAWPHLRNVAGNELQCVFGVPGEADHAFRDTLKDIAREAGYGEVTIVPEPVGALYDHLHQGLITLDQAEEGILVVDFGGGTCDFTYMMRLEVQHSWGDMSLGGRLFDDLFFQWFLDQNPNVLKKLTANGDDYFVHWYLCRKAKEFFSGMMAQSKLNKVTKAIGNYGTLRNMTYEDFGTRAREYKTTDQFRELLWQCGEQDGELTQQRTFDLLERFHNCLEQKLDKTGGIPRSAIQRVILTGSSSHWWFVREGVREVLNLDDANIIQSADPGPSIGTGLAIYPALREGYRKQAANLRKKIPAFLPHLYATIDGTAAPTVGNICRDVELELYNNRVQPIMERLASQGGSIAEAQEEIDQEIRNFDLEQVVSEQLKMTNQALPPLVTGQTEAWLNKEGIPWSKPRMGDLTIADELGAIMLPGVQLPNVWLWLLTVLVSIVFVMLPLWRGGWPWGLVGGMFAIGALGVLWLRCAESIRTWQIPSEVPLGRRTLRVGRIMLPKWAIRQRLDQAKREFKNRVAKALTSASEAPKGRCKTALEDLVNRIERIVTAAGN